MRDPTKASPIVARSKARLKSGLPPFKTGELVTAEALNALVDAINALEAHAWLDGPLAPDGRVGGAVRDLFLAMNDIAKVQLKLAQPIFSDNYTDSRATGAFILIDESTNNTVGAGMIVG